VDMTQMAADYLCLYLELGFQWLPLQTLLYPHQQRLHSIHISLYTE
jgi:hypothetical protein